MAGFIGQYAPMVQAGLLPIEVFKSMIGFVARPFKVGRELEESFDLIGQQDQSQEEKPQAPDPAIIDAQLKSRDLDIKEFKVKTDAENDAKKIELDAASMQLESIELENNRGHQFTIEELRAHVKQNNVRV
jgi:hypothetical protein